MRGQLAGVDRISPLKARHFALVVGVWLGCLAVAIPYWSASIGVEPDGVTYLDAGRNIAGGKGFVHRWAYWDPIYVDARLPTETSMWPPGLAFALAAAIRAGVDPVWFGRALSMAAFLLLPVGLFLLVRRVASAGDAILAVAVATLSWPVVADVGQVKTELPFLTLATFTIALSARAIRAGRGRWLWWGAASLAAGATFLLRYVGISCVAVVCMLMLWSAARAPDRRGRIAVIPALLPGVACVAAVLWRNWMVSGTPGQPWPGSHIFLSTLPGALVSVLNETLGAGPLQDDAEWLRTLKAVILVVLCVAAVRSFLSERRQSGTWPAGTTDSALVTIFLVALIAVTVAATARNGMNLEPRYLTLAAPWTLVLCSAWALRGGSFGEPARLRFRAAARALCAIWLVTEVPALALGVAERRQDPNYVEDGATSAAVRWVNAATQPTELILTNRGADIAFWCPNPVMRLPRAPHSAVGSRSWSDVDALARRAGARYLVHFRGFPSDAKYDRAEFAFLRSLDDPAHQRARVVADFPDAVVYRVGASETNRR